MARPSIDTLIRATLTTAGAAIVLWKTTTKTPQAGAGRDAGTPRERRAREEPKRRGIAIGGGILTLTLVFASLASAPAYANLESSIQAGSAVALQPGHELYFYLAATTGEEPIEALSWLGEQDLAVNAIPSGDQAISIGHGHSPEGSYLCGALNQATAALAVDGYAVTQVYAAQTHRRAHQSGHAGRPVRGSSLTLRFRTSESDQLVVILIAAQGAGSPKLTGVKASPLQDATYGSQGSDEIATGAVYAVQLRTGKHKARWKTTSYIPSGGSALGAVAYIPTPLQGS